MASTTPVYVDLCTLENEFSRRIKYNFKVHVLLYLQGTHFGWEYILQLIYMLNGYRCHKVVWYNSTHMCHLHIKFDKEQQATRAVEFLGHLNFGLTAVLVDDALRYWFTLEMRSGFNPYWTRTSIDIIGSPPGSSNLPTTNLLNSIFRNFGKPCFLPCVETFYETRAQVLFRTMTEALAACMVFGEWYEMKQKINNFFYEVRITPSLKEDLLIKNSGGTPEEAYKLGYFVINKT